MSLAFRRSASALVAGFVFGAGLVLGGMADPRNVLGFLDVFGAWNPRLLFVMAGAIAVHVPVNLWVRKQASPWFAPRFVIPSRRDIDRSLVLGSAAFGVGWGISGYCPGPAFVALPSAQTGVLVFMAAVVAGSWFAHAFARNRAVPPPEPRQSASV
jgi:uncharacterized membrane protein YedE/YeeE